MILVSDVFIYFFIFILTQKKILSLTPGNKLALAVSKAAAAPRAKRALPSGTPQELVKEPNSDYSVAIWNKVMKETAERNNFVFLHRKNVHASVRRLMRSSLFTSPTAVNYYDSGTKWSPEFFGQYKKILKYKYGKYGDLEWDIKIVGGRTYGMVLCPHHGVSVAKLGAYFVTGRNWACYWCELALINGIAEHLQVCTTCNMIMWRPWSRQHIRAGPHQAARNQLVAAVSAAGCVLFEDIIKLIFNYL